jgi:enoyl-CoA hydratase/3-hydroxyacyl-CoA dehydrogenase
MFVFKAAVVGAGAELAQAIAAAGIPVLLKGEGLERVRELSQQATAKLVEKGRMDAEGAAAEVERIVGLVTPTDSYEGFGDVDFVIEAVEEDLARKHEVFADLDAATSGLAILATSTAELSVTEIAEVTLRPENVVGFHPAGPRVIEIVEGDETSPETAQAAATFAQQLRRTPIRCADTEGFVAGRIAAAEDPFVEACLVLEEGIASLRDIDAAAGGVFARADAAGLDTLELDAPPVILRRLLAQGRLGVKAGQGFYPYPLVSGDGPVRHEQRGEVAVLWLDNPPANSLAPEVIEALAAAWEDVVRSGARALVLASANPALFCAGADIKAFTRWDADSGRAHLERIHALGRAWEQSPITTIAAVNGLALGGGCEIAMACDVRLAARSATFGQPEVNLGIIPGFGGTQRLARLVGPAKALEMNTLGDPISAEEAFEFGLVNRVVEDHELFDLALAWGRKAARQAPIAVEQIKRVSGAGDLDAGLAAERDGFLRAFGSDDAREGIAAFIEKRAPEFKGT